MSNNLSSYLLSIKQSYLYLFTRDYLKNKVSYKTKQSYIKHVDDGLVLLYYLFKIDSSYVNKLLTLKYKISYDNDLFNCAYAWIMHVLIQNDKDFINNNSSFTYFFNSDRISKKAVAIAFEYRNCANQFLFPKYKTNVHKTLPNICMPEVKILLAVDKIQNYHDAKQYLKPLNKKICTYFKLWLKHLKVSAKMFNSAVKYLNNYHKNQKGFYV